MLKEKPVPNKIIGQIGPCFWLIYQGETTQNILMHQVKFVSVKQSTVTEFEVWNHQ
jgi:hypothetical protein